MRGRALGPKLLSRAQYVVGSLDPNSISGARDAAEVARRLPHARWDAREARKKSTRMEFHMYARKTSEIEGRNGCQVECQKECRS